MWIEFFIFGGIWWWLLTALFFVALIWEISGDRAVAAFFTLGLYIAVIHFFGDASLFAMVSANPAILYTGIPLYFLGGTVWAIVKWYLYVKRSAVKYKEERREFLLLNNIKDATLDTVVPESLRKTWSLRGSRHRTSVPQVGRNKGRILTWMTLWPFSVVWAIIDEPWRYIYDAVASMLQRISNAVYRRAGYDSDMSVPGEEPDGASGVQD